MVNIENTKFKEGLWARQNLHLEAMIAHPHTHTQTHMLTEVCTYSGNKQNSSQLCCTGQHNAVLRKRSKVTILIYKIIIISTKLYMFHFLNIRYVFNIRARNSKWIHISLLFIFFYFSLFLIQLGNFKRIGCGLEFINSLEGTSKFEAVGKMLPPFSVLKYDVESTHWFLHT